MTMFVTKELNAMTRLFQDREPSQSVQEQLRLEYVNLEATLLRGKVLRDFSKVGKLSYVYANKENARQANFFTHVVVYY